MNQRNSTIELPRSFHPEIRQERVSGKSFKKIRYRRFFFLIRAILMVKRYMHENWKHTVKKHLIKKIKYSYFQTVTTNNSKHFFRFHIKQYWHFHWVTPKQYYTFFQTSNNTAIFKELLINNTTRLSRVYIKQYWHFQRVPSKLNYSKNLFQSTYHTVMTLSESYHQTILTVYQTVFTLSQSYYQTIVNTVSESLNGHLNRQKILKWKILN